MKAARSSSISTWCGFPTCRSSRGSVCREAKFPKSRFPSLVPDLAVEVISRSNTPKEMDEKLQEYFEKGVRLVWFVRPRSPGRRRLHGAGPLHPADGLDAARWRRRPARFLGPGRRAVPEAEATRRRQGQAEEERPAARSLTGRDALALPTALVLPEPAPIMPTTPPQYRLVIFDAIDEPQELRDLVCRVTGMHPTDAVQWLARAPGTWPQPLEETDGPRAAGRSLRGRNRGRGVADRPVSGAEPAADDPPGRLPERGLPDRGPAGRADALGAVGPDRADLRRADRRRGRVSPCPASPLAVDGRVAGSAPWP